MIRCLSGEGCNLQVGKEVPAGRFCWFFFYPRRLRKRRPSGLIAAATTRLCRALVKNVNYGNGSHEEFLAAGERLYQHDGSVAPHVLGVTPERTRDDGGAALLLSQMLYFFTLSHYVCFFCFFALFFSRL